VTAADWSGPRTPDGGPPILRLAARVLELRGQGFPIVNVGKRDKCAVYVLPRPTGPGGPDEGKPVTFDAMIDVLSRAAMTPLFEPPSYYEIEKAA
jgi:hypothetical protein